MYCLVGVHAIEISVPCNTYIISCIISHILADGHTHTSENSLLCDTFFISCIISYVLAGWVHIVVSMIKY